MQINTNNVSYNYYNNLKEKFQQYTNISDDDFNTFYDNYQNELLDKGNMRSFFEENCDGLVPTRAFVFRINPENLLLTNDHTSNFSFRSSNYQHMNSFDFKEGTIVNIDENYYLEVTNNAVVAKYRNSYNSERMKEVSAVGGALNTFIRFANDQISSLYFDINSQSKVKGLLSGIGIDDSTTFTINGTSFNLDDNGVFRNERNFFGQPTYTKEVTRNAINNAIDKYVNNFTYDTI